MTKQNACQQLVSMSAILVYKITFVCLRLSKYTHNSTPVASDADKTWHQFDDIHFMYGINKHNTIRHSQIALDRHKRTRRELQFLGTFGKKHCIFTHIIVAPGHLLVRINILKTWYYYINLIINDILRIHFKSWINLE